MEVKRVCLLPVSAEAAGTYCNAYMDTQCMDAGQKEGVQEIEKPKKHALSPPAANDNDRQCLYDSPGVVRTEGNQEQQQPLASSMRVGNRQGQRSASLLIEGHPTRKVKPCLWKSCKISSAQLQNSSRKPSLCIWPLVVVLRMFSCAFEYLNGSTREQIAIHKWTARVRNYSKLMKLHVIIFSLIALDLVVVNASSGNIEDTYSWGPWSQVTSCTRSCGTGVRYRRRVCYKLLADGMELAESLTSCNGKQRMYELCPNLPDCEGDEADFRNTQCAAYNSQPYRGHIYQWAAYRRRPGHPHVSNVNPCSLVCTTYAHTTGRHLTVRFLTSVRDGTPCTGYFDNHQHSGHIGVCINGSCISIGCDGQLYSTLEVDRCGICGGNNQSCLTIEGSINRHVAMGYTDIVTVPPGTTYVRTVETQGTSAVFALRSKAGILFVNGRSSESYPTIYRHVNGFIFRYHHALYAADGLEKLEGSGRTNQTLYVMMLQPEEEGADIHVNYEYSIPRSIASEIGSSVSLDVIPPGGRTPNFEGRPQTTLRPEFVPENGEEQDEWSSEHLLGPAQGQDGEITTPNPSTSDNTTTVNFPGQDVGRPGESAPALAGSQYRNPQTNSGGPYRYFWKLDKYAACSATCTSGMQSRAAVCYRSDNIVVETNFCEDSERPQPVHVSCEGRPCSPRWVASLWSSCSVSCGTGQQFRTVHCWRMMAPGFDSTVHDYLCSTIEKPYLARPCKEVDCGPQWETSAWGECSRKCDAGVQTRNVRCSSQTSPCNVSKKPMTSQPCNLGPCIHKWVVSDWGECSGDCEAGIRKRSVTCRDKEGNFRHDKFCNQHTRPLSVQACTTTDSQSCPTRWVPQDWGVCSVDCDWGVTSRAVVCGRLRQGKWRKLGDAACRDMTKPRMRAACREPPCKARWYTTDWSQCSKSCGEGGVRVRKVACYRDDKKSRHCDVTLKPSESEPCEDKPCHQQDPVS